MKKIVFIETQKYPDVVGGAEIFDYYLLRELSKAFSLSYISYSSWNDSTLELIKVKKKKPLALFSPVQIFIHLFKNRKQISCVHTRYSRSKWINYWPYLAMKVLFNLPYVITIHGGGLTPWKFKLFYKLFFRNATHIIGISKPICEEYENRIGVKLLYTLPLIPFQLSKKSKIQIREEKGINVNLTIFLIVGSLKEIKNPMTVINAIIELGHAYLSKNRISFFFAGNGNLKEEIKNKLKFHKLGPFVNLLGNVSRNKIHEYYALADNYIISSDFEGTPISMLEAMSNGLTIVGSNVRGINRIIKHNKNGLLYELRNSIDLAERIKLLIDDKEFARNLGNVAKRDFLSNYDYSKVIDFYSKIFEEIK